jgi:hypothetical protein
MKMALSCSSFARRALKHGSHHQISIKNFPRNAFNTPGPLRTKTVNRSHINWLLDTE